MKSEFKKYHKNEFEKIVAALREDIAKIEEKGISLSSGTSIADYKSAERKYILTMYRKNFDTLKHNAQHSTLTAEVKIKIANLAFENIQRVKEVLDALKDIDDIQIHDTSDVKSTRILLAKIPLEIRDEVKADLDEMQRCFAHECYRSCVVMCGRIIEVCLHAKYFKVTGIDILDKNPGIGLGKLIAKMDEKGIKLDPGITQQIHLVNNVRVFSVHKKQRVFMPSRNQTEAIMLYTADIVAKLF